jgi:hypothetical protein
VTTYEQLDAADNKEGGIAKGIENFKMMIGGKFNWEHLLSPAPLSVSVLGDLMVLSSVAQDFSLEKGRPENGFKYMEWPKSFRATLVQISNTGYTTFLKAHTNMDQIRLHTMAVPAQMKEATTILFSRNPAVIEKFISLPLQRVLSSSQSCVTLSQDVVDGFESLISLTMEVIAVSTATKGISEVEQANINRQLKTANATLAEKRNMKDLIEKEHTEMKVTLEKNQQIYEKTLDGIPTGWQTVSMNFVGGIANFFSRKLNSALGEEGTSPSVPPESHSGKVAESVDSSSSDSDRYYNDKYRSKNIQCLQKPNILDSIIDIQEMANRLDQRDEEFKPLNLATNGGFKPKEDFMALRGISNQHFKCSPVEDSVKSLRSLLITLKKYFSELAKPHQEVAANKMQAANTAEEENEIPVTTATKPMSLLESAIKDLEAVKELTHWIRAKASEGKQPIQSKSPLSPPTPKGGLPGDNAVANARFKVTQATEVLRQARESAESTRAQMIQVNNEYIQYMEKAQSLHIESVSYDEIIKMLSEGLDILSKLKGHWDKLNRFFLTINNLIKITMDTELRMFVKKLESAKDVKILTDDMGLQLTANLIFESAMKANQASFFVYSMSSLYVKVSDNHIMDSLASLDNMINMDPKKHDIQSVRNKLLTKCKKDSEEIIKLVLDEKQKLVEAIDTREREIEESYAFLKKIPRTQIATTPRPKSRRRPTTANPVSNDDEYDYSDGGDEQETDDSADYGEQQPEDLESAFDIPL